MVVTDGTYIYSRKLAEDGAWYRVGNGIENTSTLTSQIGASVKGAFSGFYLDGWLYSSYAYDPYTVKGVWKGASTEQTATRSLTFSKPLLYYNYGMELSGPSAGVLLCTDGERIYNCACELNGSYPLDGYRVRIFSTDGTWIEDKDTPMQSYYCDSVFTDGHSLYFMRWSGVGANTTTIDKVSLSSFAPVNRWSITDVVGSAIGGCYDPANDCFFLGEYEDNDIHRYRGPGLDLRDDPSALYRKTPGDSYDNNLNYWFRVTAYNDDGEPSIYGCTPYMPTLPNRSITAVDDPRHTTEDVGSLAEHSISGVLDRGRLQVEVEDLALSSYGPEAALSRVYRSDDTSAHGFAPGWRFSFDQSIESSGTTHRTWIDSTGERHTFTYDSICATWVAPPGLAASMTSDASGTKIELSDHSVMAFAAISGKLTSVTDRRGDQVTYVAVGPDLVITAENGRQITIERDASGDVISATDGTREVSYDTSGTASVTWFPNRDEARRVEYDYASSHLSGIAVPGFPHAGDRSAFTFTYDGSNRLSEAREPGYASDTRKKAAITYTSSGATISRTGEVSGTESSVTNSVTWNPNGTTATKTDAKVATETAATWRYTYAPNNELTEELSPTGAKKTRVVDAAGNLLYDYDELGHRSAYFYNDEGDCVREVDPRGDATYRTFDARGNLTREERVLTSSGERAVTAWTFGDHGLASSESRRASDTETYTTQYAYDLSGQVATETIVSARLSTSTAQNLITRKVFDAFGNVIAEYDAAGALTTSSTYDLAGRVTCSQDASGTLTHHVYDLLGGEIESWRSHESTSTKADWSKKAFDASGRVASEASLLSSGASATTQTVVTHTYDPMGRETSTDDAVVGGLAARSYFDARGNTVKSWPEGVAEYSVAASTRTDYDVYGRQWRTYEPGTTHVASTFTYYPDGEVLRESRADGSWTGYYYDDGGNKVKETSSVEGGTSIATSVYDVGGRLVSETSADEAVTTHSFDLVGREVAAQGEGPASEIVYNALGNVISKTDADGIRTETTYDAAGRVIREDVIAPNVAPKTTTTAYDGCGRTVSTTDPDGKVVAYAYDIFGRAVSEKHTTEKGLIKSEDREYDSLGRVSVTQDLRSGVTRSFSYPAGNAGPTTLRTAYGSVITTTTVASDGREASRVSSASGVGITRTSGLYDSAGRETTWSVGSVASTRTFNDAGQLTAWTSSGVSGDVGYDNASKKASESYSGGLGGNISSRFLYTDGGRLSALYRSGVGTETLAFDAAGNLTTSTVGGVTTLMAYDPATQRLINRRVGGSIAATYTFDTSGRRIAQGPVENPNTEAFTYTGTGRLESYAASSGVRATYSYDAVGQRTRRSVTVGSLTTTTTYTYEGLDLLSLSATRSDGTTWSVSYLIDAAGRAYAGVYTASDASATAFQMVTADRGDVAELLDASGASFAAYRYGEWALATETTSAATAFVGASVAQAISTRQPLRYAGYCFDAEEGLYYLSARTYDPVTRQFLSKDPAKADGEESAYQYCGGDPVGKVDPSGLWNAYVHQTLTSDWAQSIGIYWAYAARIGYYDKMVDTWFTGSWRYPWNGRWHYYSEGSLANAYLYLYLSTKSGISHDKALRRIGKALHALQDTYAHYLSRPTHWVDSDCDKWRKAGVWRKNTTRSMSKSFLREFRQKWAWCR